MITVTLLIDPRGGRQLANPNADSEISVTRPREYPDGFVYMDVYMGLPQVSFSKIFSISHQALTCSSSRRILAIELYLEMRNPSQ